MTTKQRPLSLPWEVFPSDDPTMIKGCHLEHEADMSDLIPVTGLGKGQSRKINAAHIVRACNSHDDLLAALKTALRSLESMYLDIENGGEFDDIFDNQSYWPMETIKAAIAKGESK